MGQPLTAAVRFLSGEREPVRVATTGNIALSGLQTVDDVDLEVGDRVLVKDQDDATENGIRLASEGEWFRAPDASYTRAINEGVTVHVRDGTVNNGRDYRFTSASPRIGTDPITLLWSGPQAAQAAAEAAQAAAEAAAAGVNLPPVASDRFLVDNAAGTLRESKTFAQVRNLLGVFDTEADFLAANISSVLTSVDVAGHTTPGDPGAYRAFRISEPSPVEAWHIQGAGGVWWQKAPVGDVIRLEMFGAFPHIACEPETKAWYDACVTKPSYLHVMHTDLFIRRLKWRGVWSKLTGLWCFAGHTQADGAINIKTPGTYNATYGGGLTFVAGEGVTGNGTTGYIALTGWNNLITQNDAAIALYSAPNTVSPATGYVVSSLTLGSGAGIGIIPRDVDGNLLTRFMSTSSQFAAHPYRGGVIVVSRDAADHYDVYTEGEPFQSPAVVSDVVTTITATLLRSSTQYNNDTIKFFASANDGLTEFEADAFSYFLRMYVDGLSAVIDKGPAASDLGFVAKTTDEDMADIFDAAASFSAKTGKPVELDYGSYESVRRFPAVGMAKLRGVDLDGSIIRLSVNADQGEPVVAPPHRKGGESNFELTRVTLDGAYDIRGHTGFGPVRPGASGLSTDGSNNLLAYNFAALDVGLHGVDISNTGEWDGTIWRYVKTASAKKRQAGVPSVNCTIMGVRVEHQGDDAVTAHYSHDFYVDGVRALYCRNSSPTSMGFEADDGSYNAIIKNIYSRGNAFGAASKSHTDNPAPSNITFEDITLECGFGRAFWVTGDTSGLADHGCNIHAMNVTMIRPFFVADSEACGVHITGNAKNVSVRNFKAKAKASDTSFLYRAIFISGTVSDVLVDGFVVENWAVLDDGVHGNGDTMRVTAGCTDVTIKNGKLTGCGKYGFWDSGSTRGDFDNIKVQGTDVASSIGFWISQSITTNKTTQRALKVISGFATEETIVA